MIPGLGKIDPKQMQKLMNQMGIKSDEIEAQRVVIEKADGTKLVIDNPGVTQIAMGGQKTFQITGEAREEKTGPSDVDLIVEQTGASREEAEKALEAAGGDIAEAIVKLQEKK